MVRRVICLLLILLMLANQGLCLAHAHQGTQPVDHAFRPHIHWSSPSHGDAAQGHDDDAVHSHDHDTDHSHQSSQHPGESVADLATATPQLRFSFPDHEQDAIYFAVTTPMTSKTEAAVKRHQAVGWILCAEAKNDGNVLRLRPRSAPMALMDASCPIFLRNLCLRL